MTGSCGALAFACLLLSPAAAGAEKPPFLPDSVTDNAIIPLKDRVVDRFYDPVQMVWRAITGRS